MRVIITECESFIPPTDSFIFEQTDIEMEKLKEYINFMIEKKKKRLKKQEYYIRKIEKLSKML